MLIDLSEDRLRAVAPESDGIVMSFVSGDRIKVSYAQAKALVDAVGYSGAQPETVAEILGEQTSIGSHL